MWHKLIIVGSVLALAFLALPSQAAKPSGELQAAGENASLSPSAWSSGWVPLTLGNSVTLPHGLGGDPLEYATQLWFRDTNDGYGINTRAYGGIESGGERNGAYWSKLTNADVVVSRFGWDPYADEVRMLIWFPDKAPDYCSPWTAIAAGASQVFAHNLSGNPLDYAVGLWFKGPTAYGINQEFFGGNEDTGNNYGAWWHNLTDSTVTVDRAANDPVASEVRVCVTIADPPSYDSGWVDINAGETKTLLHNLGIPMDRYVVRMEFKDADPSGLGIHLQNVGGNAIASLWVGAAWQNLTTSAIGIYRYADDERTDQVRLRIWKSTISLYLPLVLRK